MLLLPFSLLILLLMLRRYVAAAAMPPCCCCHYYAFHAVAGMIADASYVDVAMPLLLTRAAIIMLLRFSLDMLRCLFLLS